MKITKQKLKQIIKEELGEAGSAEAWQQDQTPENIILDRFQGLYEEWRPRTPEGKKYQDELGELIETISTES